MKMESLGQPVTKWGLNLPSKMKGSGFLIFFEWLDACHSASVKKEIISRLPEKTRCLIVDKLLVSDSYDYKMYADLLEACEKTWGRRYEQLATEHGLFAAQKLLNGIYRLSIKPGQIHKTLDALTLGWRFYFDTGQASVAEKANRRYVIEIHDPFYHPLHPPISAAYVRRGCELAGANGVQTHILGKPPRVKFIVTWL